MSQKTSKIGEITFSVRHFHCKSYDMDVNVKVLRDFSCQIKNLDIAHYHL